MKKFILIQVDVNDGDYLYETYPVGDKIEETIRKVASHLNPVDNNNHNWPSMEMEGLTPTELYKDVLIAKSIAHFETLLPYPTNEDEYIHTIVSITVLEELESIF